MGLSIADADASHQVQVPYVADGGFRHECWAAYIADGGQRRRVFAAEVVRTWTEEITASDQHETSDKITSRQDDAATLTETWSQTATSTGPSNLSASYSSGSCIFDLSWDADPSAQQEVWRCTGSGCTPDVQVDTVPAGQSTYEDPAGQTSVGTTVTYEIRSANGQSNHAETTKNIQCAS